jgi:hypothetical protein
MSTDGMTPDELADALAGEQETAWNDAQQYITALEAARREDTTTLIRHMARITELEAQLGKINSIVDNFATPDEATDTPEWRVQLCEWSLRHAIEFGAEQQARITDLERRLAACEDKPRYATPDELVDAMTPKPPKPMPSIGEGVDSDDLRHEALSQDPEY